MAFTIELNGADMPSTSTAIPLSCLLRNALVSTGVGENRRWRSATARAASEVEVKILIPTEFFDQLTGSPQAARELQRGPREKWQDPGSQAVGSAANNAYLAAKNPLLQHLFHTPFGLGDLPFVVGRRPVAGEQQPPYQPDLKLDDTVPFRLSRTHFMIEKRDGDYHVRDLSSKLGTIVNGEPIGDYFRTKDATLRAGDNEVIAGGVNSPFVFSVFIGSKGPKGMAGFDTFKDAFPNLRRWFDAVRAHSATVGAYAKGEPMATRPTVTEEGKKILLGQIASNTSQHRRLVSRQLQLWLPPPMTMREIHESL